MVELANYQDQDFAGLFGAESSVNELVKAMVAGQITGRDTTNQLLTQEPLKVESLDKTLKLLEFRMQDVKLWNALPKIVAHNTVEEFVQLESYGTFTGGFYSEGELADVADSKYRRKAVKIKYIQVAGEVTLQAQAVTSFVAAMSKEVENKTMWVVRAAANYLVKANSANNAKEFDGIYAQHQSVGVADGDIYASLDAYQDSKAVIDLRGDSLRQADLEDAGVQINANFGNVDTLFAPPSVISGLYKDYFERQRIIMGATGYRGSIGTNPKAIDTQFGDITVLQDKFMQKAGFRITTDAPTSSKAPATPLISGAGAALVVDGQSRFVSGEVHTGALGTVWYAVSAKNEYGESSLRTLPGDTLKTTLTAGSSVDLTFTTGGGAYAAASYVIYRTKVNTAANNATTGLVKFYPIFEVSAAQLATGYDGAAALSVRDRNRFLPDTEECFVTEMTDEVLAFYQLAPISKLDLAVVGPSNRFMLYLWGSPRLAQPKKIVRILNAGPYVAV